MPIEKKGTRLSRLGSISFFVVLFVLVFGIIAHNYDRYYLVRHFPVHAFTLCDTAAHSCFESAGDQDLSYQSGPYEKVEMDAAYAPSCLEEHTCSDFSCGTTGTCAITYCSEDTLEEGETCSAPAQ